MTDELENNERKHLKALITEVQQKNAELEAHRKKIERQNKKSRERTIELFGKMIDLKKAKKIIMFQNEELEQKNEEINRKRVALENTYVKFRKRTIELFGKMVDLRKAYNIINNQKKEIEKQRCQLHELNASKDKFFSIIAHGLRNPIAGFLGMTEVMAQDMNSFTDSEKQEFIELIHTTSKQLHSLLENLLQWSRAQTGSLPFNPKNLNLYKVVTENYNFISSRIGLKKVEVTYNVDESLFIWADAAMVNTILRNLINNAIKFSYKGEKVHIEAFQKDETVHLKVVDNGVGISNEEKEKLFKISYHRSKVGAVNEEGTGLGLILCKEFAKRNGGDVVVESKLGEGSTFTLVLPTQNKIINACQ